MARINKPRIPPKTISIIVDGETESWYFQLMQTHEKYAKLSVKPEIPQRKSLQKQYESVVENAKHYDAVIWVVDFDTVLKEDRERKKGTLSSITQFKQYLNTIEKEQPNVKVVVNQPCFEFWLLLHFVDTSRAFNNCEEAQKLLSKHIEGYEKTEKFYKNPQNDLYKRLKDLQVTAIKNAQKLGMFDTDDPANSKAEIYQIITCLTKAEIHEIISCLTEKNKTA